MADEADVASSFIEGALSRAIDQLRKNIPQGQTEIGSKTCMECGEDIPVERKKLGFKLCVACAEESERRRSLYAE